jgi:hypothetical protein
MNNLSREIDMAGTVKVILEISDGIQDFLERKQLDLYTKIQEEIPSSKLEIQSDPAAPAGSKDLVTIIVVATAFINALSPIIIRTFNQFKPDTTEVKIEEKETYNPDGSITIHRIKISQQQEYNKQTQFHPPKRSEESGRPEQGKPEQGKEDTNKADD